MSLPPSTVRLQFGSEFDMLDFVQVVTDYVARLTGLDDDQMYDVSVAIRESVINAIKHGNQLDEAKQVTVDFLAVPHGELIVCIADQGDGFDPDAVADPLAPENMMKGSGRGLLFMRAYMDDVQLSRLPAGGMEVRMVKRAPRITT
jgi:serine/threonine-protein kinase RsbW